MGATATGGGGIAAGRMMLGGIVALPVLAVGGLVVHHEGKEALAKAKRDEVEARKAIAEMELASATASGIADRARRVRGLVTTLDRMLAERKAVLGYLVARNDDYATYDEADREAVMLAATVAKTLRGAADVKVIIDDGDVADADLALIEAAEDVAGIGGGSDV